MKFQKGHTKLPGSGRPKGSKNKKRLPKMAEFLAEKEINPIERLLELIPTLDPEDQAKLWLDVISYCQSKPKTEPEEDPDSAYDTESDALMALIPTEVLLKHLRENKEEA